MKMRTLFTILSLLLLVGSGLNAQNKELLGAGATFPYPLYSKMFDVYNAKTGVKVNYQAIGSGGGIKQLIGKTVAFGGTDAPMTEGELKEAGGEVVHIPMALGAVVITYNLPGNPALKMTPDVLADIFLGVITKWNDPRLKGLNPHVSLPDLPITVVHRSDGSGTTFVFSEYLGKVSSFWKSKVGVAKSLNWPVGLGGKGNPGVAGYVKQMPGAIGYVELTYALQNDMPVAVVKNKSGNFIKPTAESTSQAANIAVPQHTRVSLTDTVAPKGYPIASFTWIILYREMKEGNLTKGQAAELVKLLGWMVKEGQQYAQPLHYSPLPKKAADAAVNVIKSLTYEGKKI